MGDWLRSGALLTERGERFVLITVGGTRGSSPRETGAKMIVTADGTIGTIGGGRLEHECTRMACEWFRGREPAVARMVMRRFPLGSSFGQCCGGTVQVVFEEVLPSSSGWLLELAERVGGGTACVLVSSLQGRQQKLVVTQDTASGCEADAALVDRARQMLRNDEPAAQWSAPGSAEAFLLEPVREPDFTIALFGAGHVGSSLVRILGELPCRLHWLDSRAHLLEESVSDNVRIHAVDSPQESVADMPSGTFYLVMTHSHPLDLDICVRILARDDAAFCGLIGSRSKRRRFEKRFRALGLDEARIARLTCPIGVEGIVGKRPGEIAVSVAAQLLRERERKRAALPTRPASVGDHGR